MITPIHEHTHLCWWDFAEARWTCRRGDVPQRPKVTVSTSPAPHPDTAASARPRPASLELLLGC